MSRPSDDPSPGSGMPEIVPMSDTVGAVDLDRPDLDALLAGYGAGSDEAPAETVVDAQTETLLGAAPAADTTISPATAAAPTAPAPVTEAATQRPPGAARIYTARRRRWPWVLLVAAVVVTALGAYYAVSFVQVWSVGRSDQARPVDAIVVMGAAQYDGTPSPQLAARLDHVVDLWGDGLAPLVIVTGGNQPGDRFTEAEASEAYLVDRGVPAQAVLLENSGSNSYESLESVADMMGSRGLGEVLIVTDPYHALRSRLIAEDVGMTAYVSPTPYSVVTGPSSLRRHASEAAGVALGRLIGFARLSGLTS
jgi:uncharacterized SAM-binding protein YcdF (DUF218 family)